MAYTKIKPVKHHLQRCLDYTSNPKKTEKFSADDLNRLLSYTQNQNKTEHQLYVTGFRCNPATAYRRMYRTKKRWNQPMDEGDILAYHIIQSFSPDEATPDQVHEIGCEFARRFLADRFECTVSTHLDKGHLHNHIVVNSVSYADGKMFRNNFDTYYHGIRQVSDELCRENRLSVIETDGKGKSYDEWLSGQAGKPTIRGMVRKDVEQAIAAADSFDTTFNFIATMLYTQLFDQLFRLADSTPEYNGALPVHVRLMMDEFANVALPKNFKNILAVCRSRNISCDIILQNIAQLKSLFKDDWEGIIGNCDTLLYLGGNEYGTYEYLSKILGKETERTKSQSIGKGSRGSSSDSLQTAGRELCMPDEIRRMRDDDCLLLMRSEDPVIDKKYNLLHHPNVKYTPDAGGEPYVMPPDYMGDAATITMDAVAAATAPEITEEMYEQLDYLEKHPEENYYENEENFSQYDQGD